MSRLSLYFGLGFLAIAALCFIAAVCFFVYKYGALKCSQSKKAKSAMSRKERKAAKLTKKNELVSEQMILFARVFTPARKVALAVVLTFGRESFGL